MRDCGIQVWCGWMPIWLARSKACRLLCVAQKYIVVIIIVYNCVNVCLSYVKTSTFPGPMFFETEWMDFYNLELSDTNVTDHNTHDFRRHSGIEFEVRVS